ncbi:phage-plasmid primase P4 family protein [Marine Group I thaumarchaeote SCGC AAA799-B03]|uniref:Phage-plasmid primase P4 family protein n=1 Tax=Marine Group I thaumarchaeote SCGC AAA799-B03 TaxID=1502289 RepID=A0A087S601_9ARCH|nr:phage-plasmid primase P4 family protein [Marine Group I thaumarchaeote SCGC AAA799-B03]
MFSTKFDPNHIILNQIPHNFDESKQCPNITKRVSEIIVDDNDKQSYFDFGSNCLHAYTGIDFQFGGVGIAGTGKSQLAVLLQLTFGSDNVTHATIHSIAKDPTTQKDIAYGFLNIDEELKSDDVKNIEILKKWITQGRITARSIYAHNSNFRPTSRLMFLTNGIYEIGNPDDALAIYERTHLIKLTQKFRHTKKEIKNIFENIDESEFEGFITYLLKNSTEIYKNKQINYPQSTQKTESIWNEYGNDIRNFVDTWLLNGVGLKEQASEIWNKFFTEQSDKGKPPKSKNHFYDKFNEIIGSSATLIRDGVDRYYGYHGYALRTIDEKSKQEQIDQTSKGKLLKILTKLPENDPKFDELLRLC